MNKQKALENLSDICRDVLLVSDTDDSENNHYSFIDIAYAYQQCVDAHCTIDEMQEAVPVRCQIDENGIFFDC